MKVWAKVMQKDKILKDIVYDGVVRINYENIFKMLKFACEKLDLSCPVLLDSQIKHMKQFRRFAFLPDDFMEAVEFTKFEIEIYK